MDSGLTTLYWHVGRRIQQDILKERRAEYGEEIVSALSAQLEVEFGRGFGEKNLRRMVQFAERFPDGKIVAALLRQLGWTHFTMLLPLNWLERYERKEGEEKPIGLILCADKRHETVELMGMERSGIRVSSYWTDALPKRELERKLREAVRLARIRLNAVKD